MLVTCLENGKKKLYTGGGSPLKFLLNLDKKLECGNLTMRKQGTSSEAGFLVPLLNHSTSHLLI